MADLIKALRNADAAGDTEAAKRIAAMIKAQREAQPQQQQQAQQPQEQPKGNLADMALEPIKAIGGAIGGSIAGGLAGIYDLVSGGDINSAVKALKDTQQKFVSAPKTQEGKNALNLIQRSIDTLEGAANTAAGGTAGLLNVALNPVSNIKSGFQQAKDITSQISNKGIAKTLGQGAFEKTGSPLAATAAEIAPDVLGLLTGRAVGRAIDGPNAQPVIPQDELIQTSKDLNVPLLTTDAFPPESFLGKWISRKSDQLGALGSGSARVSQQKARQDVLTDIASEYNIQIDSPFFEDVIKSLSAKNEKILTAGNAQRRKAIDTLNEYGEVPFEKTLGAVSEIIEKEQKLGDKANKALMDEANTYINSLKGKGFDDAAAIRTRLIQEQKDLEGSASEVKTPSIQAKNKIKAAIDEDLLDFAKNNDKTAAANWIKANKKLGQQLGEVKQSELKRLIEKGDVKPEMVSTILKSGKRSELKRLYTNLGAKGRDSARASIIKDLMDKSGAFKTEQPINVNKFTTEMSKTNAKQAIDVFFTDNQKKQFGALERLLNATREAQDVAVNTRSGQELVPLGAFSAAGYGLNIAPLTTLALAGTTSAALKAYESKPFRSLLLKIARTKKGSKEEKKIFQTLLPSAYAAQMAAREQQE